MKHEIKKICKIVDEMTTFLLRDDTDTVDFRIKKMDDRTIISIVDYNTRYTKKEVDDLIECFNVQRQREVEEYYWQLVGESDDELELTIIGVMIDSATVEIKHNNMYIELVRMQS